MPPHLRHITLNTGNERESARSEVREDSLSELQPLIVRALQGEHTPVPGKTGFTITGARMGRCCMLTLWGVVEGGGAAGPDRVPVLSTGVCADEHCGADLWHAMHAQYQGGPLPTGGDDPPDAPWCADRLEVGLALYGDAAHWTGDLSRRLAWAWLGNGQAITNVTPDIRAPDASGCHCVLRRRST